MEEVNLGILGKYSFEDVVCDSDFTKNIKGMLLCK